MFLHQSLPSPSPPLTASQAALLSHKIIVMTETMKRTIDALHRIPYRCYIPPPSLTLSISLSFVSHVQVIPHGVPVVSAQDTGRLSPSSHRILVSNGLIHQGKGLEYAIDAIPALLKAHPSITYHILGTPHPTGTGTREYYQ
jgi:glycosyltransferase involved in cell wall biosynthesis